MIITLSVMTNRGAETDSYQPMRYPSDESLPSGASVGPVQHQHLLQVVADPYQPEMTSVSHLTEIATARHPIVALQSANDPLHCPTNAGEEPIPPFLPGGHGPIAPGPVDDAAKHSPAAQPRLAGILGIGPIGKHGGFVAPQHLLQPAGFGEAGPGQGQPPHQAAALRLKGQSAGRDTPRTRNRLTPGGGKPIPLKNLPKANSVFS